MKLLILGGINEAVSLAKSLHQSGITVVYSIAGLVRQPELPSEVISGGFSKLGGLGAYLQTAGITHILDATHPYASKMSAQAIDSARAHGIPCWRYLRAPWLRQARDNWHEFEYWDHLSDALIDHNAVFFTVGRLSQDFVDSVYSWTRNNAQRQWVRSATKPAFELPPSMTWLEAIGPYAVEGERELMNTYQIDAVISKNSGGEHARAKLQVARERHIPVYMLKRPRLAALDREFDQVDVCHQAIVDHWRRESANAG